MLKNSTVTAESDFASGVFEPDVIVPSHFTKKVGTELSGGERRLMAALLSDGIESYISYASGLHNRRLAGVDSLSEAARESLEWVDTKDFSYVFRFDNVCQSLGIDPDYLRKGLRNYLRSLQLAREAGNAPKRPWKRIRRPRK